MVQANVPHPQPDWESLNEFNFLLYRRTVDGLNAALTALDVATMPDKSGMPPEWWHARSRDKVEAVLNLAMAWSWLIQYKVGIELTQQVIRPFALQEMLDWLTTNLQLRPPLYYDKPLRLLGNKQCIQEAILLLHSVAGTLGRVSLKITPQDDSVLVVILVSRLKAQAPIANIETLLSALGDHWRERSIAFELRTALDFLNMNNLQIHTADDGQLLRMHFAIPVQQAQSTRTTSPATSPNGTTDDTIPTVRLQNRQRWHLPKLSHRIDPLLLHSKPKKLIQAVPPTAQRPGGWHKPLPRRTLQLRGKSLDTPIFDAQTLAERPEAEPPDHQRTELEEKGDQSQHDKLNPKGSAYDGQ